MDIWHGGVMVFGLAMFYGVHSALRYLLVERIKGYSAPAADEPPRKYFSLPEQHRKTIENALKSQRGGK